MSTYFLSIRSRPSANSSEKGSNERSRLRIPAAIRPGELMRYILPLSMGRVQMGRRCFWLVSFSIFLSCPVFGTLPPKRTIKITQNPLALQGGKKKERIESERERETNETRKEKKKTEKRQRKRREQKKLTHKSLV